MARFTLDFYSKSLYRRFEVNLIIPSLNLGGTIQNKDKEYYQHRETKYPLLICFNGFGDNEKAWINNSHIDELCEKNGVAAVFINGQNKFYLNQGPLDNYYDLVEEDILDFLYGNFSNLSKEAPLIIAGVSMGGYGALYHYINNVEKYDYCFAFSPATKPDMMDEETYGLRNQFLKVKGQKLNCYISVGEKDFIIEASKRLNNHLKENEIDAEYKIIPNYDHSWSLWREEVVEMFNILKTKGLIG